MNLVDIITPERVIIDSRSSNKDQLLQTLCRKAADDLDIDPIALLTALKSREELGSTGMGDGIALPHLNVHAVSQPYGLFARLEKPIDFNAVDAKPVDLVFLLLLPGGVPGKHLNALACAARQMRNDERVAVLRGADDAHALYAALTNPVPPDVAV